MATRSGATLHVEVLDENKRPMKQQSLIRLTSEANGRVFFQTTRGSEATFPDLPVGQYLIEVGSAGYLGMHERFSVYDVSLDFHEKVTLAHDPAAVDLTLRDASDIPPKARKQAEKGVRALELSNFVEARKYLEAANHDYSSSSSINFLLGYLYVQLKDLDRALEYLKEATKIAPRNIQAQNLLGQVYFGRGDYAHAVEAEEVVIAHSANSMAARKVLANSYLKLKQYEKARESAQWLVDNGGSEGASARLVLGQALVGLQKNAAAIDALLSYLDAQPASPAAPQVRKAIGELQQELAQGSTHSGSSVAINDPDLAEESASGSVGMPLDIDAQKPTVVPGVQCPANILQASSNPSRQLVDSIAQFSAVEHMVHENLSPQGTPRNRESRQYNYVASISEPTQGMLIIQEYRDAGELDMPDKITTTGLPVLAIAFHPHFRDDFDMQCEGLGDWNGQPAWLIHFRQLDSKPSRLRAYVVNKNNYPVSLKGRAWISADNFQILHLETDLVREVPEIKLLTEHTSVSYGPVQFKKNGVDLWLPTSAELYVRFAKLRFHRSENFDHFMLFATDASTVTKIPKEDQGLTTPPDHGASQPQ